MSCAIVLGKVDKYLDGYLAADESRRIREHLAGCRSCREAVAAEEKFRGALRSALDETPSAEFTARAFGSLPGGGEARRGWWLGFSAGGALAAAAVILFLVVPFLHGPERQAALPGVRMALNVPRTIQVLVDVPRDLPEATITIALPENIEFDGLPGRRDITWTANLHAGSNLLALPVVARHEGSGILEAQVTHENKRKSFQVNVVGFRGKKPLREVRSAYSLLV